MAKIRGGLVTGLALLSMFYAISLTGVASLGAVEAEWCKGCCETSRDCSGQLVCYTAGYPEEWAPCDYVQDSPEDPPRPRGYCNTAGGSPSWECIIE
jgi:hypothetical protein